MDYYVPEKKKFSLLSIVLVLIFVIIFILPCLIFLFLSILPLLNSYTPLKTGNTIIFSSPQYKEETLQMEYKMTGMLVLFAHIFKSNPEIKNYIETKDYKERIKVAKECTFHYCPGKTFMDYLSKESKNNITSYTLPSKDYVPEKTMQTSFVTYPEKVVKERVKECSHGRRSSSHCYYVTRNVKHVDYSKPIYNKFSYENNFVVLPDWTYANIPAVKKLIDDNDKMNNRNIILFAYEDNGDSAFAINTLKEMAPEAKIIKGFALKTNDKYVSKSDIKKNMKLIINQASES